MAIGLVEASAEFGCILGLFFVWVLVLEMEENNKAATETHLTSAAAFVEGGVQDACDDACSICLEPFTDDDPGTVMFFFQFLWFAID